MLIVGGALAAMAWLISTRPTPPTTTEPPRVPEVAVVEAAPQVFDAPIVGHGTVRPKRQVKVIPQVSGMLTAVHPDLAEGRVIQEGELLFEIDRRTYESQVLQVEADIKMLEVQLKRHQQQEESLTERLALAREQLELAQRQYERDKRLLEEEAGTDAEVDLTHGRLLQAQDVVLGLQSELDLIPILKEETQARLEARRAQLGDAQRNLGNTRIFCPFDVRVESVAAQTSQVVIANLAIATLTDLEAFEIAAVLDPSDLRWTNRKAYARALGEDLGEPPSVTVTWTFRGQRHSWTGYVTRLERHDEATRTARLVVEIPNRREDLRTTEVPGHPQLSLGMFCTAAIPAEPLADALVVPRSAIHQNNQVYVFEPDPASLDGRIGRLAARQVPLLRSVGNVVLVDFAGRGQDDRLPAEEALVECELRPGELAIVSPLPRAVVGMKLRLRAGADATTITILDLCDSLFAQAANSHFRLPFPQLLDAFAAPIPRLNLCPAIAGTR